MRVIDAGEITKAVRSLCIDANHHLPADVQARIAACAEQEVDPVPKEVFRHILENAKLAATTPLALCQDTGLALVFVELGQQVAVTGQDLRDAINEGVRQGYKDGCLRKSAAHPLTRVNTGDNTPAIIYFDIVPGDAVRIHLVAKGFGAENMSRALTIAPSAGWEGIRETVLRLVAEAGPNPCPPTIIGVGVGGTLDHSILLAKKAMLRPLDDTNPDPDLAAKEDELLHAVNALGIGPMGLGGKTTCLAVKIALSPCHIGSLPLAVNFQCHSSRHKTAVL